MKMKRNENGSTSFMLARPQTWETNVSENPLSQKAESTLLTWHVSGILHHIEAWNDSEEKKNQTKLEWRMASIIVERLLIIFFMFITFFIFLPIFLT